MAVTLTRATSHAPVDHGTRRARGGAAVIVAALFIATLLIGVPLASVFVQATLAGLGPALRTFSDPSTLSAVRLTLGVAAITVVCNTAFGLLAAWTVTKYRFPGKALLLALIDLPLSVSPIVAGLAILLAYGVHSPVGGWLVAHGIRIAFAPPGIVIATVFVTFPYIARELITLMQQQGRDLEEAALLLGASTWQAFARITLPNIRWALLDGILLCNARAMGEFGAVSVISGRIRGFTDTVPLHIEILYNEYNFVSAFTLAAVLASVTIALTLVRRFVRARNV